MTNDLGAFTVAAAGSAGSTTYILKYILHMNLMSYMCLSINSIKTNGKYRSD